MYGQFAEGLAEDIGLAILWVGLFFLFLMAWLVVDYVLRSLSLHRLGEVSGVRAYGLAWVPGLHFWTVGGVADKYDSETGKDHGFRWLFICLTAVMVIAYILFVVKMGTLSYQSTEYMADDLREVLSFFGAAFVIYIFFIIACTAFGAVRFICYYKIFELCKPEKSLLSFLIALLVPFAFPFVLLSCANAYTRRLEEERAAAEADITGAPITDEVTGELPELPGEPGND